MNQICFIKNVEDKTANVDALGETLLRYLVQLNLVVWLWQKLNFALFHLIPYELIDWQCNESYHCQIY